MSESRELDVAKTLEGKSVLLIGTTGFVGKVCLSMLLRHYPGIGRVYCLVRPGMGNTASERFYAKVATSPAFDPLREVWGDGYEEFLREKVVAIPGDIGRPLCNFEDEQFAEFEKDGGLDVVLNSAGLVSFMPSLESAVRINAMGAKNVLEAARRAKAALVHVSTCYVAGRRDGDVWENEPVVGYFPRNDELRDDDFDAEAEIADCVRLIERVRERANDRAHISEFRERAAEALKEQRRDPDDEKALKLAVARERKIWIATKLTELGMERAEHWGWTNTYTYTKSLGEQIILADKEVRATIVRPAVVESSRRYPFAGWNEGFNTTAPLIYLALKGQRQIPAGNDTNLDLVPVDYVAAGMIMATAAVVADEHEPVYQLGTSGVNPVTAKRLTELTGLAVRRHRKQLAADGVDELENKLRARLETFPVSYERFYATSSPRLKKVADGLIQRIDEKLPKWGAPRLKAWAERARDELEKVSTFTGQVIDLVEMFKPFNYDHDIAFRSDNVKALHERLTPADQQALMWDPETIDWRAWWIESHFPGLVEWVFPVLDDEFGPRPRSVYTYKDLLELFDATVKLNRHRVAMRFIPTEDEHAEPVVYTYERIRELARVGAASLRERGVEPGDRVMLMSENRPEWGIGYFAILEAGAAAVPLDKELTLPEVANLARASGAVIYVGSDKVMEELLEEQEIELGEDLTAQMTHELCTAGGEVTAIGFDQLLSEPSVSPGAVVTSRRGDHLASIIYTSGTTGEPKGVMLTDKNLTSMVSKLSSVFKLYRHDGLLSVLPLHHTFEFSAGFLMPLVHGSTINYLEEVGPDGLNKALKEQVITGMVGVPALWQLLHRRIYKTISDQGPLVRKLFDVIVDANKSLRDTLPYDTPLGKVIFFPIHRRLGGRMRILISGGSALNPDILESFRGLGFKLVEGYGMTESSPVLTVMRPNENPVVGSVGRALPGIDVKIHEPDSSGIGEVIARGPNVMRGYYQNDAATEAVLRDGWLHTGDLGRMDEDGNLFIVGRKKEMILGPSGENVYPDELEDVYIESDDVKELSIVGLPSGDSETVAALVVPDYEQDEMTREEVRERVREHMRETSAKLPLYKRVKVFHLWDHDLPRTSTRKVKRREVVTELQRLEKAAQSATTAVKEAGGAAAATRGSADWVLDVLGQVTQKGRAAIQPSLRLEELGFDSLMFTELGVALDAAGVALPDASELAGLETVADVQRYVEQHGTRVEKDKPRKARANGDAREEDEIHVPEPLVRVGREALRRGLRGLYDRYLDTTVYGRAYVPPFGGYIVAANHSSHLDTGLVKHALGENGDLMVALAAKDYFFEDPVRKMYFENFTNLVPMERHGSLRESLRIAGDVISDGHILLIFPEGTRSETGVMIDFKPSLGYLAMHNRCGILPVYLAGTHEAMPKGRFLPKQGNRVAAYVAPFIEHEELVRMTEGMRRSDAYRTIATHVERIVRRMAPAEYEWTLGASGRAPAPAEEAGR